MARSSARRKSPSKSHPYRVITGKFLLYYKLPTGRHQGLRPDGDTIGFKPTDGKKAFKAIEKSAVPGALAGANKKPRRAKFNPAGICSLRFEAIDAIELHFEGTQQDDALAKAARDRMLADVGFKNLKFSSGKGTSVRSASPETIDGYVITRGIDPNGRPVSFVFTGNPPVPNGSTYFLTAAQVRKSVNAGIMKAGHAYPTFYTGLPTDLRKAMVDLNASARSGKDGLWKNPNPFKPVRARNIADLEISKIWPKLFRRLVSYFRSNGNALSGFDSWLRSNPKKDDVIFILSSAELGNMHDVVKVANNKVALAYDPADLIIVPT